MNRFAAAAVVLGITSWAASVSALTLYVAPSGNDA